MNPRYIVLTIYPLLLLTAGCAVYQSVKLAKVLPSQAWTTKRRVMIFFMIVQVFGISQNLYFHRPSNWTGALYFSCTLLFCLGLNWFDYCLLRDNKRLQARARAILLPDAPELSGELPPEFWRAEFRDAIRATIKPEFLRPD